MLYFSYGSNMSSKRLCARVPSAKMFAVGILRKHLLKFHKHSFRDNSAKCDIEFTNKSEDIVYGVLYKIDLDEKPNLDHAEGLGLGYEIKTVEIKVEDKIYEAFTYYGTDIDKNLKPFHWYKNHVLKGANEFNLPKDYILKYIESIESIDDKDKQRELLELSIQK